MSLQNQAFWFSFFSVLQQKKLASTSFPSSVFCVNAKEPNLFGIKARITNAPPLPISKFSCLYEVMVHLSLLVIVHGSIYGEICRITVLCNFEPICRQTFINIVNLKQFDSRNLSLI